MTTPPPDRRTVTLGLAGAAAAAALPLPAEAGRVPSGGAGSDGLARLSGRAFGAGWSLLLPAGIEAEALRGPVEAELEAIDREMSPWRADSAVTAFNRRPMGEWPLPGRTLKVVRAALAVQRASDGAFDPTVGPLVARWGFGPIREGDTGASTGLGDRGGLVAKTQGATLDLCGIAKGFALDRLAALLRDTGIRDALIEVGGELLALGRHPLGRPWRAGVEDPRPGASGLALRLPLKSGALATSGTRWNGYASGGRRVSHVIDPWSGAPTGGALLSVSVLAASGMAADAWSTALMAAGPSRGPALARARGLRALFLLGHGEGPGAGGRGLARIVTGSFPSAPA
jgi:thiamine biosynthesis lipoprotein